MINHFVWIGEIPNSLFIHWVAVEVTISYGVAQQRLDIALYRENVVAPK